VDKPLSDELSERLELLESECQSLKREMHRWRRVGVTVSLIGVLLLAFGGAQKAASPAPSPGGLQKGGSSPKPIDDRFPPVIASGFLLVDPDSKVEGLKPRAVLTVDKADRSTVLTFLGPKSEILLSLRAGQDGRSGLIISGKDGKQCINLLVNPDRSTDLTFFGADDKANLNLYVTDEGERGLSIYDKDGKERLQLNSSPDGSGGLFFGGPDEKSHSALAVTKVGDLSLFGKDKDGNVRFRLNSSPDGAAGLVFHGSDGKYRFGIGINSEGNASLQILDKEQKDLIGLGVSSKDAPMFYLRNKDGDTLFKAPQP
jgi:hypothetical protein